MIRKTIRFAGVLAAAGLLAGCVAAGAPSPASQFEREPVQDWPSQQVLRSFPDS